VFVVLFAVLVLGSLFPVQLLDPAWQRRFGAVLVNAGTLPLTALALLQLAHHLAPRDPRIRKRQQRFAQLAIGAAFGFLLLAPLLISASLRLQSSGSAEQLSRLAPGRGEGAATAAGGPAGQQQRRSQRPLPGPQRPHHLPG
jgi:hypothetical protein